MAEETSTTVDTADELDAAINTGLKTEIQSKAGLGEEEPTLSEGSTVVAEKISGKGTTLGDIKDVETTTAKAKQVQAATEVTPPAKQAAATYSAYVAEGTPESQAVKGKLSSEAIIGDIQGAVSERSLAQGVTGEVDPRSTVRYQIGELFESFEEGKEPPAWASPAIRSVTAMMQSRGLGSSSMASAAITQSIMEAGIPIAKSDADRYAAIQLTNLNNQQQAALQNATVFAAMDKANLDARMTAAVNNAKAFLSIDVQNLTGEQRMSEITYQGELQKMFADQAAINAARNFNAESQTQVDQFYAQLGATVEAANANRVAAQQQFNVNEANAMAQFNANVANQNDQFNATMRFQIDQSNAVWRRQQNTADTAAINEANRINAQNLFNMSETAQNNLWNMYRDTATWIMQTSENEKERAHQFVIASMEKDANADLYDKEMLYGTGQAVGEWVVDVIKIFRD